MATKEPWVNLKFTCKLKNKPKNYTGLTSETYNIAVDKPIPLSAMIASVAIKLSEFHYVTTDISAEQINDQLKKTAAHILNLKYQRVENEVFKALDEMNECKEAGNQ